MDSVNRYSCQETTATNTWGWIHKRSVHTIPMQMPFLSTYTGINKLIMCNENVWPSRRFRPAYIYIEIAVGEIKPHSRLIFTDYVSVHSVQENVIQKCTY